MIEADQRSQQVRMIEEELLHLLERERDACAALLAAAQEAQEALRSGDAARISEAYRVHLRRLGDVHRSELACRTALHEWADLHDMVGASVRWVDLASRLDPERSRRVMALVESILDYLWQLSIVNRSNRALVGSALKLNMAILHQVSGNESSPVVYEASGLRRHATQSFRFLERRA